MSIGTGLAEARYRAGLTVAQVSQQTRIREVMIRAIEQDDYAACGGDFYARGHIRAMARAVGVDPEPLIQEYDVMHGGTPEYSPPPGPDAAPTGDPYGQQHAAPGEHWAPQAQAGAPGSASAWQNLSRPDPLYDEPDGYQPAQGGGWEQSNVGWTPPGAGHVSPVPITPASPWESPAPGVAAGWDRPADHDPGPPSWEAPAGNGVAPPAELQSWEPPSETAIPPNAAGWTPAAHDAAPGGANWEATPGSGTAAGPAAPGWAQPSEPPGWAAPAGNSTAHAATPEAPAWNAPGSYHPVHPPGPGPGEPGTWAGPAGTSAAPGEAPAAWEQPARPSGWAGAGAAGAGGYPGRSGGEHPGPWEDPAPARFGGLRDGTVEPEQDGGLDALFGGGDYDEEPDEAPRETAAFAGPPPRSAPPPPRRPSRPDRSRSGRGGGSRTQWAAIAGLVLVAVLGVVAFIVHTNTHPNASASGSAGGATQHATAPASHAAKGGGKSKGKGKTKSSGSSTGSSTSGTPQPVTPLRAVAFGPGGPPHGDNPTLAGLAVDGKPGTDWETDWYSSATFGGLQQGTGLLLVLKQPVKLTNAKIIVGQTPGTAFQVRAGNTSTLAGMPVVAQSAAATGVVNLKITSATPVRYVLIWFTSLPPAGGGHYQADLYNVALTGSS